jgi:PAS domain S-box-containing protein
MLGSWEWDVQSGTLWWSEGIWLLHGHSVGQVKPSFENWLNFAVAEDRAKLESAVQSALKRKRPYEVEYRCIWPDGSFHWIAARGQVSYDARGAPTKMVGIGLDITEQKQTQEALLRSEKLVVTGRLAASIAHEINNPLEAVMNLIFLAKQDASMGQEGRDTLAMAEKELMRVAHITRQTLGFYRDHSAPVAVDLTEVMRDVLATYARRLQENRLAVRTQFSPAIVTGFPGEMRQILSNIVANAADAMKAGGTLTIRIHAAREWNGSHRNGCRITVADSGVGIAREEISRIFEPFYTTKKDMGTGLGLWLTQSLVEKHGGTIAVRSRTTPGASGKSGTVVSLFFPAEDGQRAESDVNAGAAEGVSFGTAV